jgi:myo-inositol 2-dehydrogenase/D-chiro-inositol 1-dehydrogenase
MNAEEGERMTAAVEKAGVPNMVWYNYRRVPAITLAKQLIDEGRLGRIFHYRAKYLQDWTISPELPQGGAGLWRLDASVAGSGVTGDLLAHSIDTAIWLTGGIEKVTAITETFIKERQHNLTGKKQEVTIDDACAFLAKFDNGALATFESTRYARGRKNQNTFEINGEHGSLYFDLEDPHQLQFFDNKHESHIHGWQTILVTDFEHPYMDHYWVPGTTIGYEHTFVNATADFLKSLEAGQDPVRPNFRDALETQYVCDAVLKSGKTGVWESCKA